MIGENWGRRVFGAAAIMLGLIGLTWGDFSSTWQPVPDDIPARKALAYAAAVALVLAGGALQWRLSQAVGAIVLGVLYAVFAALWGQRVAGFPQVFGTWLGFAEQSALVLGALVAFLGASSTPNKLAARVCQAAFGVCLVVFGAAHLIYVPETASFIPTWIPPGTDGGRAFWAEATGFAHIMAGLAFGSGVLAALAGRLASAMFIGFGLLVWLPKLLEAPTDHVNWGGNAVNLALVGAVWVVTDSIRARMRKA